MARVSLREVSKAYNGLQAVKSLSLDIGDGEFLAILGPPGAGKSSTIKMIAGVEPITSGELRFDDRVMNDLPPNRRDVSMVFESYALYPHLTAFDNIAYPLREKRGQLGLDGKQIEDRVRQIAELLQITEQLGRRPAHLSGGQRQRVALGRALVRNPRVCLLDEPIAHLDARLRHQLRGELKRIQRERRTTTVYSTPDYLEALAMADRIVALFEGRVHQIGTPKEILEAPATAEVAQFVGDPPMNVLPGRLTQRDGRLWCAFDGIEIPVPARLGATLAAGNFSDGVLMGIRASDIVVHTTEAGGRAFPADLYLAERLHRKTVLSIARGEALIKINTSPDFAGKIGDRVWLQFPEDRVVLFDPKTSRVLTRQLEGGGLGAP